MAADGDAASSARPENGSATGNPDPDDDVVEELTEQQRKRRHRELILLLTPLTLAVIAGFVARGLFPTLIAKAPIALIALDPSNLNLVAAAPLVDPVPYFLVATARLLAVDPFTYVLGRRYGDAGVRWIERNFTSLQPTVELLERLFAKVAPVAVAVAPGAIMCTLAGAVGMKIWVFAVANLIGTVVRLAVLRWVGDAFASPVEVIRDFFAENLLWTTAVSLGLVAVWLWSERRRGRADAETPSELAEDFEQELEGE